jgi:cytochrome P450
MQGKFTIQNLEGRMARVTSMNLQANIPGPLPVPLLGWLPHVLPFAFSPLSTLEMFRDRYGSVIKLGFAKYPVVIVFDPEHNRQILRDPSTFYSYNLDLVPVPFPRNSSVARVTTGMPLMNGTRHKDHRSALLPYFHKQFITRYHDVCIEVTEKKIASWKIGAEVNLRAEMEQLAMWLATSPVLGLDPQKEGEAIGRQLERTMKLIMDPFVLLFPYNIPGNSFHRLMRHTNAMESVVKKVIQRKKKEGLKGDDILSAMIRMHQEDPERLTETELIGHTTTMFRGGYNPNGMVLYWSLFLLSQYPDKLKLVRDELKVKLGGNIPTPEQLENLPYLEGVIRETMRLFPAGTWTGRLAMRSFELNSYSLPKGTWIVLSPYLTHRIPELFPEPYKFLPERWLSIRPSAYEFMPFSAGPRYCIGTSLGLMQLKIALAIILQRYSLSLKPYTVVNCVGFNSIRPKNGLPMSVNGYGSPARIIPFRGNVHKIVDFKSN